jgi:hypothetical protein
VAQALTGTREVPQIRPRPLIFASFPVNYSPSCYLSTIRSIVKVKWSLRYIKNHTIKTYGECKYRFTYSYSQQLHAPAALILEEKPPIPI